MAKRGLVILVSIFVTIVVVYLSLFIPTLSVIKTVKSVYCGEISAKSDSPIRRYDLSNRYPTMVYADMKIIPLFVIHNWQHGYMYVLYSSKYMDAEKNVLNASCNILSKWEIEKKNGEWIIIDIEEAL